MKKCLFLFILFSVNIFAQIDLQPKEPLRRDPFFTPATAQQPPAQKVNLIHADDFIKQPDRYGGSPFFSGNVRFEHQGSVLTADVVILYQEQNFIKAIGNVKLANADGSVITAEEMEYDGNTQKGIARKNVVLTDPKQTIKTETLYYDRLSNLAYYNTGGTVSDGQNVMYSRSGTYNVATKMIDFTGSVKIDNPQYTLEGNNIKQNQNTNTAEFTGPTTIRNRQNSSNYIYTESGTYNMTSREVFLNRNSRIHYNGKILRGDRLFFNQNTGFGRATGNVRLDDPLENRFIKGGYGEIFEKKDSAMITEKPYVVKILQNDSIYFSAEKILSYQRPAGGVKKKSFLRAYTKARFFKSNAQARADSLTFDETDGVLRLRVNPVLWSGQRQVTGDKIDAYFDTEKEFIDSLNVSGNAFAIAKVDTLNNKDEFHQVKGRRMAVYYNNNEVKLIKVIGNAQAITYADSENEQTKALERIGVLLSTCGTIEAEFEARTVQIIACNFGANGELYPMSKIAREKRFFPDFNWNTKDRLRKWQDIFLDSPNYPEIQYISDDSLYDAAQKAIDAARAKEEAKKPQRIRR